MFTSNKPPRLFVWTILVFILIFSILVLAPFYLNNVQSFFVSLKYGDDLPQDITNFTPFSWRYGMYLRLTSIIFLHLIPIYIVVFSVLSIYIINRNWNNIHFYEKISSLIVISLSLALLLITYPDWWKIGYWLAD